MFLSIIQKRRSIRKYQKRTVESQIIIQLIEAGLRAPSSRDRNPWEFIVIDEPVLLEKLSQCKPHGSSFLRNAPLGIVVCADSSRSDVWIEDTSIAITFIQLFVESMGLGSCWIQIRERIHDKSKTAEEYVKEALHIPGHLKVEAIIAIGYPAEELPPHPQEELKFEKVSYNKYQQRLPTLN
jgi:nitroreductase